MSDLELLKNALPKKSWTTDPDIIAPHLTEWRDKYFGTTPLMLMPGSTDEVSKAVKICAAKDIKIVPQGGNTGLVGGQTPQGEVLISMKRMIKIRDINPLTNALVAEAGATLDAVHKAAESADRTYPMLIASQGSCTVGGTLSTNAGGNHVLKYGTTKDLVFGVEAVLPDGSIYDGLTSLRKDNTGYDVGRLFLGAEGTLGIITAASLKLFPRPGHVQRVMAGTDSPASAMKFLERCRIGSALAMFEVIPQIGLDLVTKYIPDQRHPFTGHYPWYVLLDWEVDSEDTGQTIAEQVLSAAFDAGTIQDAVVAQSETQAASLLSLREHMSAAQKFNGGSVKLDITVPLDKIPAFFKIADPAVQKVVPGCRPVGFGHFGDGNIHYNIAQPKGADKEKFLSQWDELSNCVFDIVDSLGGSISAEHGIGIMKRDDLAKRSDPVKIDMLRATKKAMDPKNIMNPRVMISQGEKIEKG